MTRENEQDRTASDRGVGDAGTHRGPIDPAEVGGTPINPLTAPGQFAAGGAADRPEDDRKSNRPTQDQLPASMHAAQTL